MLVQFRKRRFETREILCERRQDGIDCGRDYSEGDSYVYLIYGVCIYFFIESG
jgi:hypothetical protein